jgi:hypothetical protein
LAVSAGLGFYKRKIVPIWIATIGLIAFSLVSLPSIGVLYLPFGLALIVLISINRKRQLVKLP